MYFPPVHGDCGSAQLHTARSGLQGSWCKDQVQLKIYQLRNQEARVTFLLSPSPMSDNHCFKLMKCVSNYFCTCLYAFVSLILNRKKKMTRSYYSWFYFLCVLQVCFKDLWFLETGWLSVFSVHAFLHVCAHESTVIDVR